MNDIENQARLQLFAELACYSGSEDFTYIDPTDPTNRSRAKKWFDSELSFLCGRDRDELLEVWQRAIDDPRDSRLLFTAIKVLQSKY